MSDGAPRYRLGPRSTRGLVAGWRTGQIVAVAIGAVLAIGTLRSLGGLGGAFVALLVAGAAVAFALWPVGGRTAEEWVPTVARYGAEQAAERLELVASRGHARPWSLRQGRAGAFARLRLEEVGPAQSAGGGFAAMVDEEAGTWSGVMLVGEAGFALLDEPQRAERIAAWSSCLAALANEASGGLHRLQWMSRTLPAYLVGSPPELPPAGGAGAASYAGLLADVGPELWGREALVAVTVRSARRLAPHGAVAPAGAQLARQLALVGDRIRAAGLACGPPLRTGQLAACLRRASAAQPVDEPVVWPWPVGVDDGWSRLRSDEVWHASYWVSEWPRSDVGAAWLLPLLVAGGLRHTVSLTMAPMPATAAVRRAERERTSGTADAELRRRHGFVLTARARREQEARHERESELAAGHAGYRFAGYVTVTAADPGELEHAAAQVEQAAAVSQVELRRLYGAQLAGFLCTLPLGRGCPSR